MIILKIMAEGGRKKGESRAGRKLTNRVLARTSLLSTFLEFRVLIYSCVEVSIHNFLIPL